MESKGERRGEGRGVERRGEEGGKENKEGKGSKGKGRVRDRK